MTPLDEAPEQRWRRTVDRRNRPAKLKVDRLLRDFGYAELDDQVGDAIEARLAGVALAVAPSLRDASANAVVTIYANDGAAPQEERTAPPERAADPLPAPEPAAGADVAQMVTYLKQQVLDARAEAERLRTALDRRIANRESFESEDQAMIAEQAAALREQNHQIAELGAALEHARRALTETRDEIRRAVGELPELLELPPVPAQYVTGVEHEPADAYPLTGAESAEGREEAEAGWIPAALEPPLAAQEPEPEPESQSVEFDLDEPPLAADAPGSTAEDSAGPGPTRLSEWLPDGLAPRAASAADTGSAANTGEFYDAPPTAPGPDADADADGAGDPAADDDELLTGFDDFLYDVEDLYDPDHAEPLDETPPGAPGLDQLTTALPPPPPAPPSPFEPEPEPPAVHERPTIGKVLRGRSGRSRGRWGGSCSVCGRLPVENRRRDLEAAGWDLNDETAACPQCRGLG